MGISLPDLARPRTFSRRRLIGVLLVCLCGWLAAGQAFAASRHRSSSSRATPAPSASASPADSPADGSDSASSPLPSPDASASPSSSPASASGTPSPAFVQKYEAAMVQFLQKDYPGAIKLLSEADAIQPGQSQSVTLRNQIFKQYYEAAYAAYQHADYPAALGQLDGADATGSNAQNQSDAYNLRGLVLSKQRNYVEAENMFHKASQTDPGLWAAKFNYAEVPFNYRNFTVARARFEELFAQTDPAKQPVEAELTQFKVFLTLLLEGKEDAARTFMQHFNFSGATPARYFCQAALNFYTGDVDKAQGWIDSARKEYPSRKSSSFLEAFYRVGWLTDPNAPGGTGGPALVASASGTPSTSATFTPAPSAFTPAPAASPSASPVVAAATPKPTPAATVLAQAATPKPTPTATAVVVTATPKPTPTATAIVAATAKSTATPTATAVVAAATPKSTPTATATVALASATPKASPTLPAVALTTPRPTPSATVAPTLAAMPSTTPEPSATVAEETPAPSATPAEETQGAATTADAVKIGAALGVLFYFLYVVGTIVYTALTRKSKPRRRPAGAGMPSYKGGKEKKTEHAETPR